MNSEFQIIRWGIPGWTFFMTVLLFKLTILDFELSSLLKSFENPALMAGIAAFFVALGVPLGYVLYQVYYAFKWRTIKAEIVLLATKDIPELASILCNKSGLELWYTIEGFYDSLMTKETYKKKLVYEDLVRRNDSFSNRTSRIHGLGASALAMFTGFLFFIITTENRSSLLNNNLFLLTFLSFGICLYSVFVNYKNQNKYSFVQLNLIMQDIIDAKKESVIESEGK